MTSETALSQGLEIPIKGLMYLLTVKNLLLDSEHVLRARKI